MSIQLNEFLTKQTLLAIIDCNPGLASRITALKLYGPRNAQEVKNIASGLPNIQKLNLRRYSGAAPDILLTNTQYLQHLTITPIVLREIFLQKPQKHSHDSNRLT